MGIDDEAIRQTVGETIAKHRLARHWSLRQLAEKLPNGESNSDALKQMIWQVERGGQDITITRLYKFAVALGVAPSTLLPKMATVLKGEKIGESSSSAAPEATPRQAPPYSATDGASLGSDV